MATSLGNNRFEGDFGMPKLPGKPLTYESGDYVRLTVLELMAREIYANRVPGAGLLPVSLHHVSQSAAHQRPLPGGIPHGAVVSGDCHLSDRP